MTFLHLVSVQSSKENTFKINLVWLSLSPGQWLSDFWIAVRYFVWGHSNEELCFFSLNGVGVALRSKLNHTFLIGGNSFCYNWCKGIYVLCIEIPPLGAVPCGSDGQLFLNKIWILTVSFPCQEITSEQIFRHAFLGLVIILSNVFTLLKSDWSVDGCRHSCNELYWVK